LFGDIDIANDLHLGAIRPETLSKAPPADRGVFKDTDGLAEIRAKQRQAETEISRVFSELVVLRGAVDRKEPPR
jgi:hypothetical protein